MEEADRNNERQGVIRRQEKISNQTKTRYKGKVNSWPRENVVSLLGRWGKVFDLRRQRSYKFQR